MENALITTHEYKEHGPSENPEIFQVNHNSKLHRWISMGEWTLLVLAIAYFGLRTLPHAWRTLNTDFPNYYLTARLTREHYDTSRIYEWIWIQRQKDHHDIDQRIVGMVPITPFSTLVIWPLTSMPVLTAKHGWLIVNLCLLFATLAILRALTHLPWRRIVLVSALSIPLQVNFLLGQYYVLLLFLLTLACWLYIHQRRFLAGVLVGLASGLKIFPILYLVYFARKKDLKAFVGTVVGCVSTVVVSFLVFGWKLNHTYLTQVLPAALRGEALGPYNLKAASLSSLLHRLFLYEPQLNPHPAMNAPWLFAIVHPLLQMAVMAPALLLVIPKEHCPRQNRLEWAAILLVTLTLSTSPASYLFILLILPVCLIWNALEQQGSRILIALLLSLYLAAGVLRGSDPDGEGWYALLNVPRLYVLILLCVFVYVLLIRQQPRESLKLNLFWATALGLALTFSIAANLRHQQGLYADYQWRIFTPKDVYAAARPGTEHDSILFTAFTFDGYRSAIEHFNSIQLSGPSHDDYLAITSDGSDRWVERAGSASTVMPVNIEKGSIPEAESPIASSDGRWLAFLREDHGRAQIWLHALNKPDKVDRPLTPAGLNVLEMTFLPSGSLIFSAVSGELPQLFITDQSGNVRPLGTSEARYPSASSDGHWLAYSQLDGGNWNLWLHNLDNGKTNRLTHAACNNIDPAWTPDSRTLIYASDCGRALWFTALCRRPIFP
ncbi:MAG TPA: glycosyltransferase 87 family protein [Edaphobacter sp.]|nr:glycosyltransferase 87 family protein [Edaphobacter sp.]